MTEAGRLGIQGSLGSIGSPVLENTKENKKDLF
jgi:hypothetical protein